MISGFFSNLEKKSRLIPDPTPNPNCPPLFLPCPPYPDLSPLAKNPKSQATGQLPPQASLAQSLHQDSQGGEEKTVIPIPIALTESS